MQVQLAYLFIRVRFQLMFWMTKSTDDMLTLTDNSAHREISFLHDFFFFNQMTVNLNIVYAKIVFIV